VHQLETKGLKRLRGGPLRSILEATEP
jgi:hypothetical protein